MILEGATIGFWKSFVLLNTTAQFSKKIIFVDFLRLESVLALFSIHILSL